jgi:hypothetical protein
MLIPKESFKIGDRVKHVRSGSPGTVVGGPRAARTAGGAIMVRVRWDNAMARKEGSQIFARLLTKEEA